MTEQEILSLHIQDIARTDACMQPDRAGVRLAVVPVSKIEGQFLKKNKEAFLGSNHRIGRFQKNGLRQNAA